MGHNAARSAGGGQCDGSRIGAGVYTVNWPGMSSDVIQPAFAKLFAGQTGVAAALKEMKAPLQALVPRDLP